MPMWGELKNSERLAPDLILQAPPGAQRNPLDGKSLGQRLCAVTILSRCHSYG